MKLYNLYEEIILESKGLLTEGVSEQEVNKAINERCNVNITYDDYPGQEPAVPPSKRYIQPYDLGTSKAGNKMLSAFQIFGGSKTTPGNGAWKNFRLDRIRSWQQTTVKFARPVSDKGPNIPAFNPNGNKNMTQVTNKVQFNTQTNGQ